MRIHRIGKKVLYLAVASIVALMSGVGAAKDQHDKQQNQRNKQLEVKVFRKLSDQGLRDEGQILALALGNEVILLGDAPEDRIVKVEEATKDVESVKKVDNRLKIPSEPNGPRDLRLAQRIRQKIQKKLPETAPNLNVRYTEGAVVVRGNVANYRELADVIETAFAAGAPRVVSRLRIAKSTGRQITYEQGQQKADRQLTTQIKEQLNQHVSDKQTVRVIDPEAVCVVIDRGAVGMLGPVKSEDQKQKIEQVISSVEGVRTVDNALTVTGPQSAHQGQMSDAQQHNAEKANTSKQQASDAEQSVVSGRQLSRNIQKQIDQEIGKELTVRVIEPNGIYVAVNRGNVVLFGSVDSNQQKDELIDVVKSIDGIKGLESVLAVDLERQRRQAQEQMSASDQSIAHKVEQRLRKKLEGENAVFVVVENGTATLHGSVEATEQREQAAQIAKDTDGVNNVENELTVDTTIGFYPVYGYFPTYYEREDLETQGESEQTQQLQEPMEPSREERLRLIDGREDCVRRFEQHLTTQRRKDMAEHVFATCQAGKMVLFGFVQTAGEKAVLETVATKVRGVVEVENNLMVKPDGWEAKPDAKVKEDVESEMWWSPFVDGDRINVSVKNGLVTLTGRVDDWDAALHVLENAYEGGARDIINRLQYDSLQD